MTRLARLALALALAPALLVPACGSSAAHARGHLLAGGDGAYPPVWEGGLHQGVALAILGKLPYASQDACRDDLPVDSAERGCVEGLFADEEVDYGGVLECRAAASSRASSCLNSKTCTDTARGDCHSQLVHELEDCDSLPPVIEARLNDCLHN